MRIAFCAALVLLVCGCGSGERSGVPDGWTHKDLAEHLAAKGLKYRVVTTNLGSSHGPAAFLVSESSSVATEAEAEALWEKTHPDVVYCQIRKTARDAREAKEKAESLKAPQARAVSGRFLFAGDPQTLEKIGAALPQPGG